MNFLLFLCVFSSNLFAHGMNSLGPNKGYIKMPANYHTELVEKTKHFHVYLTDMTFQSPITTRSSVTLYYNKSTVAIICKPQASYFECPKIKHIKSIKIHSMRNGTTGSIVEYNYPLKLK